MKKSFYQILEQNPEEKRYKDNYEKGDPKGLVRNPEDIWESISPQEKFDYIKIQLLGITDSTGNIQQKGLLDELMFNALNIIQDDKDKILFGQIVSTLKESISEFPFSDKNSLTSLNVFIKAQCNSIIGNINGKKSSIRGINKQRREQLVGLINNLINKIDRFDVSGITSSASTININLSIPEELKTVTKQFEDKFNNTSNTQEIDSEPEYANLIIESRKNIVDIEDEVSNKAIQIKECIQKINTHSVALASAKASKEQLGIDENAKMEFQKIIVKEEKIVGNNGDDGKPATGLYLELQALEREYQFLSGAIDPRRLSMSDQSGSNNIAHSYMQHQQLISDYATFIQKHSEEYNTAYTKAAQEYYGIEKGAKDKLIQTRVDGLLGEIKSLQSNTTEGNSGIEQNRKTIDDANKQIDDALDSDVTLETTKQTITIAQNTRKKEEQYMVNNVINIQGKVVQIYTSEAQRYEIEKQYCNTQITISENLNTFHCNQASVINDQLNMISKDIVTKNSTLELLYLQKSGLDKEITEIDEILRNSTDGNMVANKTLEKDDKKNQRSFYLKQIQSLELQLGNGSSEGYLNKNKKELEQLLQKEQEEITKYEKKINFWKEKQGLVDLYIQYLYLDGKKRLSSYNELLASGINNQYQKNIEQYKKRVDKLQEKIKPLSEKKNGGTMTGTEGAQYNIRSNEINQINNITIPGIRKEAESWNKDGVQANKKITSKYVEKINGGLITGAKKTGGLKNTIETELQKLQSTYPDEAINISIPTPQSLIPQELNELGTFISSVIVPQTTEEKK